MKAALGGRLGVVCAWIAVLDGGQASGIIYVGIELGDAGVLAGHYIRERVRRGRVWVVDASRVVSCEARTGAPTLRERFREQRASLRPCRLSALL
jgi:hypothetical protein